MAHELFSESIQVSFEKKVRVELSALKGDIQQNFDQKIGELKKHLEEEVNKLLNKYLI